MEKQNKWQTTAALKQKKDSESRGKLRGIGVSSYFEACGIAPSAAVMSLGCGVGLWESAEVRFNLLDRLLFIQVHIVMDKVTKQLLLK